MSDKIIEDFENFINEMCGFEKQKPKRIKNRWKIEKERYPLEEFIAYRKELDYSIGDCHKSKYICGNQACKEEYEIYLKPEEHYHSDYYDGFNGERTTIMEYKHSHYFCVKCGAPFQVNGEVKFIRNAGFPRIAVTMEDDGII